MAIWWPSWAPPLPNNPLPAGAVSVPPNALGGWISTATGVIDKSWGANTLFYVSNNGRLLKLPGHVQSQEQFCRRGPVMCGLLGIQVEASTVRLYVMEKMNGTPHEFRNFNCTV